MMGTQLRKMSIGDILDGSFRLYWERFGFYYMLGLLPSLVTFILNIVMLLMGINKYVADPEQAIGLLIVFVPVFFLLIIVYFMTNMFTVSSLSYAVSEHFLDRKTMFSDVLRVFRKHFWPLLGASIIMFILIMTAAMFSGLIIAMFIMVFTIVTPLISNGVIKIFFTACLALFCIIIGALPIVFLIITFLLVTQIIVIEEQGVFKSFGRSFNLMRNGTERGFINHPGFRAGILLLLCFIICASITVVCSLLPSMIVGSIYGGSESMGSAASIPALVQVVLHVLETIVAALVTPFYTIVIVLFYYDLRIRSEGFDLEMMAKQMGVEGDFSSETSEDEDAGDDDSAWPL
jgi:hypothetical protein